MANVRLIRRRIRSAKNISQITRAMELVAASKMRKAQAAAVSGKLYAQKIYDMVMELSNRVDTVHHPLLMKNARPTGKSLVVVISTNKGLCGALNTNLFRFLNREYPSMSANGYVTLGRKGADFLTRMGASLEADFSQSVSFVGAVPALIQLVTEKYMAGSWDSVDLVYSEFVSVMNQAPRKKTILPLTIEAAPDEGPGKRRAGVEFLIEPNVQEVFNLLLPHYLENQVRDAVLQGEASEHSARMIAMRNATDNANNLVGDLQLVYNKARQEKITYEISDMVTARLAVEG